MAMTFITDFSEYSSATVADSYFETGGWGFDHSGTGTIGTTSFSSGSFFGQFTVALRPTKNSGPGQTTFTVPVPATGDFVVGFHLSPYGFNSIGGISIEFQGLGMHILALDNSLHLGLSAAAGPAIAYLDLNTLNWLEVMCTNTTATVSLNGVELTSFSNTRPASVRIFPYSSGSSFTFTGLVNILSAVVWTIDGTSLLGDFPHGPVFPRKVLPDGDDIPLNFTPTGGGTHFSKVLGADLDGGAGVVATATGADQYTLGTPTSTNRVLGATGFAFVRSGADAGNLLATVNVTGGTTNQSYSTVTLGPGERAAVFKTTTAATVALSSLASATLNLSAS